MAGLPLARNAGNWPYPARPASRCPLALGGIVFVAQRPPACHREAGPLHLTREVLWQVTCSLPLPDTPDSTYNVGLTAQGVSILARAAPLFPLPLALFVRSGAQAKPTASSLERFEKKARLLRAERRFSCCGADFAGVFAGLRLNSRARRQLRPGHRAGKFYGQNSVARRAQPGLGADDWPGPPRGRADLRPARCGASPMGRSGALDFQSRELSLRPLAFVPCRARFD